MSRQNPSYSGQPRRSTGSSTHHKSSRKQYTMYRETPEKDPKPRRRRSTDGVTAAQLSKFIVPALLAAAAVLALQQLSQGADNAGRYAILRRLGAQESMVSRCAVEQVALAFLLPLALALIHSVVGMKAANDFIAQAGKVDALQSTAVTALMLLVVYGGYFLATALACRRLALQGTGARR